MNNTHMTTWGVQYAVTHGEVEHSFCAALKTLVQLLQQLFRRGIIIDIPQQIIKRKGKKRRGNTVTGDIELVENQMLVIQIMVAKHIPTEDLAGLKMPVKANSLQGCRWTK